MDEQQKKVEQLLKSGAGFDESRVEIAKFLFQEYGHSSSRLLTKAFRDEVQNPVPSMYTAAVAAAISGLPPNSGLPSSKESSLFARAKTIEDLSCPEEEFRLQVSVTRKSLKRIFDVVKTIVDSSFKYNDLLMIAWYLSSGESTLEEVAMVFELPGPDTVLERLTNTSRQLLGLRKNAKMDLPIIEFEEDDIADSFERRTGLPQVLGALGVFKLECADGTYICALSVCDHRHYFRHLSLYTDLDTTSDIVRTSPIFERLSEDHPKGYTYFCPAEGYPFLPQLTPNIQPDELDLFEKSSAREFSLRHNKVVNHLRTSIREVTSRFPKLNHLETACPDIVEAAFLLHNLCIDTRDTSVNFDDPDAVPPPSSLF